MSASWSGIMRGPRLKTPLLVLLLLLTALTQSVVCQDEEEEISDREAEILEEEPDAETGGDGDTTTPVSEIDASPAPDPLGSEDTDLDLDSGTEEGDNHGSGDESRRGRFYENYETTPSSTMLPDGITMEPTEEQEMSLLMILVPVVLVVLLIGMILCGIFINRRWKQKARNQELVKDDPYLDGSSTEKVPMPMFEEDVPSVLELEMEELDQWMKKDSETADDSQHA